MRMKRSLACAKQVTPQLEAVTLDALVRSRLHEIDAREAALREAEMRTELEQLKHEVRLSGADWPLLLRAHAYLACCLLLLPLLHACWP